MCILFVYTLYGLENYGVSECYTAFLIQSGKGFRQRFLCELIHYNLLYPIMLCSFLTSQGEGRPQHYITN